ncbi:MAG TPA: DUF1801 domain-containing protein [Candidatus Sulfotelmatobacter sp.]|nr:DUF1801 domain-containing protein [Candidatus Sulfotelmatobacter sp.]
MAGTKTDPRRSAGGGRPSNVWSDAERAAMRAGARERRSSARPGSAEERAEGERDLLEKIAQMPERDRAMAERIHAVVTASAPALAPKTYYGMPAYALDGKTVCFFKPASKFKERYATFGFEQRASLDDGAMWPVSFALLELTPAVEQQIAALVKRAADKA